MAVVRVIPPSATRPIIESDTTMSQEFRAWTQIITNQALIIGTDSPEGVIESVIGALYMDRNGTEGSILSIKRDADIAGDRSKGWFLV